MVVAMPLYPSLTKVASDKELLKVEHSKYLDILVAVSLPALIGLCVIAEPLLKLFFNERYLSFGVELFWLLALSIFILNFNGHYISHAFQFRFKTHLLPWITGLALIINVTLLLLLLTPFGIYGAAYSSLICNLLILISSAGCAFRFGYCYRLGRNGFKVIVSSLAMLVGLLTTNALIGGMDSIARLIVLVATGAITYGFVLISQNSFDTLLWLKGVMKNE